MQIEKSQPTLNYFILPIAHAFFDNEVENVEVSNRYIDIHKNDVVKFDGK